MKWRFFHELHGGWQWQQVDAAGIVVAQGAGFATHAECAQDAKRHGYVDAAAEHGPDNSSEAS